MILHIVPDDKFIDMAYDIFEEASPDNNEFIVVTKQKEFKYIKTTPVNTISSYDILSEKFTKKLSEYDFIVLHTLNDMNKKIVLNSNKDTKFIWIGWGFDYYCYLNKNLLFDKTFELKQRLLQKNGYIGKDILQKIKNFIQYNTIYKNVNNTKKVLKRIDYFAPVLYEDYLLIENQFLDFYPKYLDWNYGTLENDFIKEELKISGKNILLGNSASFENNHIEAIELLSDLDLSDRKIICPLSYGLEDYAKEIIDYGEKNLGTIFEALINFMQIDEYNKIIATCSIVIMNHLRQQAVGNIVIMMYFGAKIFLHKENPVYNFLKNNGAIIFSMKELTNENINIELTNEEKNINRKVLRKHWAKNIMLEKTKKLIETMRNI